MMVLWIDPFANRSASGHRRGLRRAACDSGNVGLRRGLSVVSGIVDLLCKTESTRLHHRRRHARLPPFLARPTSWYKRHERRLSVHLHTVHWYENRPWNSVVDCDICELPSLGERSSLVVCVPYVHVYGYRASATTRLNILQQLTHPNASTV